MEVPGRIRWRWPTPDRLVLAFGALVLVLAAASNDDSSAVADPRSLDALAVVLLAVVLLAAIAVTVAIAAFVAGFETATETHQTSRWTGPLGSGIEITTDTTGNASTVDLTMPAAVPAALIVFLIGSRTWHLATRRS